jgi:hypothetical protein
MDSHVLEPINWSIDTESLLTGFVTPMKHPRDMVSNLRSSTINPFLSLQRRCRRPRKLHRFVNPRSHFCCHHTFQKSDFHSSPPLAPRHPSRLHIPPSLNWDQDPRLADLTNALRLLGWVRRWRLFCIYYFYYFIPLPQYFITYYLCCSNYLITKHKMKFILLFCHNNSLLERLE